MLDLSIKTRGKIIGIWKEEPLVSSVFVLSNKNGKKYISQYLKTGGAIENEVLDNKTETGIILRNKEDIFAGEYYIINNNGDLDFVNKSGEVFANGKKIK